MNQINLGLFFKKKNKNSIGKYYCGFIFDIIYRNTLSNLTYQQKLCELLK